MTTYTVYSATPIGFLSEESASPEVLSSTGLDGLSECLGRGIDGASLDMQRW
jgi:hypothetical protein